jgi:hypothetical protein
MAGIEPQGFLGPSDRLLGFASERMHGRAPESQRNMLASRGLSRRGPVKHRERALPVAAHSSSDVGIPNVTESGRSLAAYSITL